MGARRPTKDETPPRTMRGMIRGSPSMRMLKMLEDEEKQQAPKKKGTKTR